VDTLGHCNFVSNLECSLFKGNNFFKLKFFNDIHNNICIIIRNLTVFKKMYKKDKGVYLNKI